MHTGYSPTYTALQPAHIHFRREPLVRHPLPGQDYHRRSNRNQSTPATHLHIPPSSSPTLISDASPSSVSKLPSSVLARGAALLYTQEQVELEGRLGTRAVDKLVLHWGQAEVGGKLKVRGWGRKGADVGLEKVHEMATRENSERIRRALM